MHEQRTPLLDGAEISGTGKVLSASFDLLEVRAAGPYGGCLTADRQHRQGPNDDHDPPLTKLRAPPCLSR